MTDEQKNSLFRDPHKEIQLVGNLPFTISYTKSQKYPKTCSALSNLAAVTHKDNEERKKGNDNYNASLEKLLNSLDTFIREKTNNNSSAGKRENYRNTNNCQFTIRLLWQFRNILTHQGGVINRICKTNYERIFQKKEATVKPIIELPSVINEGEQFYIQFQDYTIIYRCVFEYFREYISEEDLKILDSRATITNVKLQNASVKLDLSIGSILLDVAKATEHGVSFNTKTREIVFPPDSYYSIEENRFYFNDRTWLPAELIKKKS